MNEIFWRIGFFDRVFVKLGFVLNRVSLFRFNFYGDFMNETFYRIFRLMYRWDL